MGARTGTWTLPATFRLFTTQKYHPDSLVCSLTAMHYQPPWVAQGWSAMARKVPYTSTLRQLLIVAHGINIIGRVKGIKLKNPDPWLGVLILRLWRVVFCDIYVQLGRGYDRFSSVGSSGNRNSTSLYNNHPRYHCGCLYHSNRRNKYMVLGRGWSRTGPWSCWALKRNICG